MLYNVEMEHQPERALIHIYRIHTNHNHFQGRNGASAQEGIDTESESSPVETATPHVEMEL